MKKQFLFLLLILGMILNILAQNPCSKILTDASSLFRGGNLDIALEKLQKLEICDDKGVLRIQRQKLQREIFNRINQQRKEAIRNEQLAVY